MNTENIPQVGSKWNTGNLIVEVTGINKRGRGYQVQAVPANEDYQPDAIPTTHRLAHFLKVAKPL